MPLNYESEKQQDAVSKPGLEPTTHPQRAGLQKWVQKFSFAVIILIFGGDAGIRTTDKPFDRGIALVLL